MPEVGLGSTQMPKHGCTWTCVYETDRQTEQKERKRETETVLISSILSRVQNPGSIPSCSGVFSVLSHCHPWVTHTGLQQLLLLHMPGLRPQNMSNTRGQAAELSLQQTRFWSGRVGSWATEKVSDLAGACAWALQNQSSGLQIPIISPGSSAFYDET